MKIALGKSTRSRVQSLVVGWVLSTTVAAANEAPTPLALATQATLETQIELWASPATPPPATTDTKPEIINHRGSIQRVSIPSLVPLPAPKNTTGIALIVLPGGGYSHLDWTNHVRHLAEAFHPLGVSIYALKYRTGPWQNLATPATALLDAQRAVRLLRALQPEKNITRIGVAGYSAGGHLALLLASNFTTGDPADADPIERQSSRPDFVVGLSVWALREPTSPFVFPVNTPPVILFHATDDKSAPVELAHAIQRQLRALRIPCELHLETSGGHAAFHFQPARSGSGWPKRLLEFLHSTSLAPAH
ncbi:alpha/beta hydrolase [Oleiharenicola lentus]|uniref:alpha/beta hydrolase n=1 Tax=Oleiharenicola lentus TaxID=2508720 RepID=UPI003F67E227